ncbi:hypothetical protein IW262DRAFT_1045077 [Armillaria fumosa]|nr:hypothetical protein IW262DRAFT_280796 [Armillaria fumosa]KAK0218627.1 hypothetical protein IW262DRAFT_1045077 [Armillaria fumosa]
MPLKQRTRYIIISAAVGATIGAILAPIIAPAVLGFGAAGPIPGGIAAKIQSGMGNVPPGSLFSRLQSMAMGGPIGPEILVYIIPGAAIVGIVGALAGLLVYLIVDRSHSKSDWVDDSRTTLVSAKDNDVESAYEMKAVGGRQSDEVALLAGHAAKVS